MKGSGFSSWPTATPMQTRDGWVKEDLDEARSKAKARAANGNGFGLGLGAAAGLALSSWQTPVSDDQMDRARGKINSRGEPKLSGQAAQWKTPSAADPGITRDLVNADGTPWKGGQRAYDPVTGRLAQTGLPQMVQAMQWPTPASRDHKGENSADHLTNGTGRKHMDQLPNAVAHGWHHPDQARPMHGPTFSQRLHISRQLRAYMIALHGRATWRRLLRTSKARRLNPLFVEWLMAWPEGHALCLASGMAFIRWQQDMRGALSQMPMAYGPWIWKPPGEVSTQTPDQLTLF